jgi:hypothetical protein
MNSDDIMTWLKCDAERGGRSAQRAGAPEPLAVLDLDAVLLAIRVVPPQGHV